MPSNLATINEYRIVASAPEAKLAFVTATIVGGVKDKDTLFDEISLALNNQARPVKDSFRWLDERKNYAVGFVVPNREVRSVDGPVVAGFREVAANIYMDEKDQTRWEMKEGHSGKYLARQGVDDLAHLLESARVSPRGSTPRISFVQQAKVAPSTSETSYFVAFVNAARYGADMDYGVCIGHNDQGDAIVVANSIKKAVAVPSDVIVSIAELDTKNIPSIRNKVKAASAMDAKLTPEEYWKLQYSYSPEYMNLVLQQVREMSAL